MFWPRGGRLAYSLTSFPNLLIIFYSFFHIISYMICITPSLNYRHPIDPMGIHLLCYAHGNECTVTHDAIHDTFAVITRNASFHMEREQLHVFRSTIFNSFCQRVNVLFTKNNICTLADVVIIDPMRMDLFPRSCATQRFVTFDTTQAKERSYHN